MKTYKQFLAESMGDGYCAVIISPGSENRIREIISKYTDIPLINKLHVTVMFDESNPQLDYEPNPESTFDSRIGDIDMLGDVGSKYRTLALKLISPELIDHHNRLTDNGYKHSYEVYTPHISLIYGPTQEFIDIIMLNKEKIINEIGNIILTGEYFQPIKKPDPSTA